MSPRILLSCSQISNVNICGQSGNTVLWHFDSSFKTGNNTWSSSTSSGSSTLSLNKLRGRGRNELTPQSRSRGRNELTPQSRKQLRTCKGPVLDDGSWPALNRRRCHLPVCD